MIANWKAAQAAVAVVMAAALATGCGVSKSKYLEVTQSSEQMTAKNQALQTSLDSTNAKKDQLEKDIASMQTQVSQLTAELETTKQATVNMQSTYEGLVGQLKGEVSSGN